MYIRTSFTDIETSNLKYRDLQNILPSYIILVEVLKTNLIFMFMRKKKMTWLFQISNLHQPMSWSYPLNITYKVAFTHSFISATWTLFYLDLKLMVPLYEKLMAIWNNSSYKDHNLIRSVKCNTLRQDIWRNNTCTHQSKNTFIPTNKLYWENFQNIFSIKNWMVQTYNKFYHSSTLDTNKQTDVFFQPSKR